MDEVKEMVFEVEREADGGLVACAVGACIITQAGDLEGLKAAVRDAVCCHYEDRVECPPIRLRLDGAELEL